MYRFYRTILFEIDVTIYKLSDDKYEKTLLKVVETKDIVNNDKLMNNVEISKYNLYQFVNDQMYYLTK